MSSTNSQMSLTASPAENRTLSKELKECYLRSTLSGLSIFGISYCTVYFIQMPLMHRIHPTASKFRIYLPSMVGSVLAYMETARRIKKCRETHLI